MPDHATAILFRAKRQTGSEAMSIWKMTIACSLAGAVMAGQVEQAAAAPLPTNVATMKAAVGDDVTQVYWRGRGFGWGIGGLAAGAIIGSAIASSAYGYGYYGGGPYYGGYGYPGPAYGYAPAYYGGYGPSYAYGPGYGYGGYYARPRYYGYRAYRPYYGPRYGYYRPYRAYHRAYW
jgi:hypothetical protein